MGAYRNLLLGEFTITTLPYLQIFGKCRNQELCIKVPNSPNK
ncbi:mCG146897 [Mus musculus]|nr:mCG146897 [Mus musculus]